MAASSSQSGSPPPAAAPMRAPLPSGFGSTAFDVAVPGAATRVPRPGGASVFDVCHVGVVLRGLLFVHAVVGIGVLFAANSVAAWLGLAATGAGIAVPGVLLWLLVACACRRPLGAARKATQWSAALGLGALCGALGALPTWWLAMDTPASPTWLGAPAPLPLVWLAPAVAGAAFAGIAFQWLALRAEALLPADTTARLAELQARIRPHFLFNTLNTALALVRIDPARAEGVLEDLAELFRVAIRDSADAASLGSEVELAQRYLAIEQIRFGSRLAVTWELDPAAAAAQVPPLLLQPLVENAVRHGVEPADAGGVIRIRTRVRLGRAIVSISNSVAAGPSRPGHGIALRNVRERLRLMHDVAATFDARLDGNVFEVQLVVPL